jgi:hypothetical protein
LFVRNTKIKTVFPFTAVVFLLLVGLAAAEIIYLKNGDVVHGAVVGATARQVTLQTPYGKLIIPKNDIQRIEYEGGTSSKPAESKSAPTKTEQPVAKSAEPDIPPREPSRALVSLEIRGRAFWYAFESPPDNPADLSIRLRLFLGDEEAAMLLDSKPDTYDGNTYYNSFTFSPTDSKVIRTGDDYKCEVIKLDDDRIVLNLELPEKQKEGQILVRMLYQINEGSRNLPRWNDAVSRAFSVQVEPGQEAHVVLRQDSTGLDYSGMFRKTMKNVESFQLNVMSADLREPSAEPKP